MDWKCPLEEIPVGKGRKLKEGSDLAVITIGPIGNVAARAITRAEADFGLSIAHYDLRFLKPLDEELLHEVGRKFQRVLTIEDGIIKGGMGSTILEFMADNEYKPTVKRIGIPNLFVYSGFQPFRASSYQSEPENLHRTPTIGVPSSYAWKIRFL